MTAALAAFALWAVPAAVAAAGSADVVDFTSPRWTMQGARVVEHLGRQSLAGTAYLGDVDFADGVIEVDVAADGRTSYPGLVFRMQSLEECERFYIRPHRLEAYADGLQYTPVFNGNAGWQLYSGPGYTAGVAFPTDQWVRVRLVVEGAQAAVFIGEAAEPALIINRLERGLTSGAIGLMGPGDGSAFFSNFSYRLGAPGEMPAPAFFTPLPGVIADWQISQSFKTPGIDLERVPEDQGISGLEWQQVGCDQSGLVDVSRYRKRVGQVPDCVFARTTLVSEADRVQKLLVGYSDLVSVFINGKIVFNANNGYRYRDPSATGVVGPYDAVYLPLSEGPNQLTLAVAEGFGGWGFICVRGDASYLAEGVSLAWETPGDLKVPESVAYDAARDAYYASNYDIYTPSGGQGRQFISRIGPDGRIRDLEWCGGLNNPTGLVMAGGRLFAVDRPGLVEIDPGSGSIVVRHAAPQPGLLNDAAADHAGTVFVSDSARGVILKLTDGKLEEWLDGLVQPNGLAIRGQDLIVGNNGDCTLRAVNLATREVSTIARFASGTIDGIAVEPGGGLLVSHVEGRLYRIDRAGRVEVLLDTSVEGFNCADFAYTPASTTGSATVVVPGFVGNTVRAYVLPE